MCGAMYKIEFEQFEVGVLLKFWVFPTQPKTNFLLCFELSFKLLSYFFLFI